MFFPSPLRSTDCPLIPPQSHSSPLPPSFSLLTALSMTNLTSHPNWFICIAFHKHDGRNSLLWMTGDPKASHASGSWMERLVTPPLVATKCRNIKCFSSTLSFSKTIKFITFYIFWYAVLAPTCNILLFELNKNQNNCNFIWFITLHQWTNASPM